MKHAWLGVSMAFVVCVGSIGCGNSGKTPKSVEPSAHGPAAAELVSAGEVTRGPNGVLVSTLGQPTQATVTMRSSSYRLHGGLVGANGGAR